MTERSLGAVRKSNRERGAILIMMALFIVPLSFMVAVVVDLGLVRWQRATLQNGADTAAVAAGNMLSAVGSGQFPNDGLPQSACTQALASLRQNVSGFTATDVAQGGGCGTVLPDRVSKCIASTMAPMALTAVSDSGNLVATLTYPLPSSTDQNQSLASNRVTFVRASASPDDPNSIQARCRVMSVQLVRKNMTPYFSGVLGIGGQTVTVRSVGATTDPGFPAATTLPTGPTTTTAATTTTTTTLPPTAKGNFVSASTLATSDCSSNLGAPSFTNLNAGLSSNKLRPPMWGGCSFTEFFQWVHAQIWSPYGIGSNGQGTVILVGDQDRYVRFTGCSSSTTLSRSNFSQTNIGWTGGSAGIFYDVTGVGTHWVEVGTLGQARVSNDDGVTWHNAAHSPGGALSLTEVATDGSGTWIAAASYGFGWVYRSTDNGETWSSVGGFGSNVVRTVTWDKALNLWVAAGTLGRVYTSSNGTSWAQVSTVSNGLWGLDIISITAGPDGTLLAAGNGFGQVYRSTSGPTGPWTSSGGSIPWSMFPQRVRFITPTTAVVVGIGFANNAIYASSNITTASPTWTRINTSDIALPRTFSDVASCTIGAQ